MSTSSTDLPATENNNNDNTNDTEAASHGAGNKITIREYDDTNSSDQSILMSLVRELQSHEVVLYDRMKPPNDLKDETYLNYLRESCQEDDGVILFAETTTNNDEDTNTVVGYAVVLTKVTMDRIEEREYIYGEIAELALTQSARGQGIGPLLMKACEDRVKAAGDVAYLRTEVLASNAGARKAYSKFGFQDHLITMEKKL